MYPFQKEKFGVPLWHIDSKFTASFYILRHTMRNKQHHCMLYVEFDHTESERNESVSPGLDPVSQQTLK